MLKTVLEESEKLRKASETYTAAQREVLRLKTLLEDAVNQEYELQKEVEASFNALSLAIGRASPPPAPPTPPKK